MRTRPLGLIVCVMLLLLATLFVSCDDARANRALRSRTANSLRIIAKAFEWRSLEKGQSCCIPPPFVRRANGVLVSWRVLVLPYLDEGSLYHAYNIGDDWDAPSNRKVLSVPAAHVVKENSTFAKFAAIYDVSPEGDYEVLAIIQAGSLEIPWTKPEDIPLKDLSNFWREQGETEDVLYVLFRDGVIEAIPTTSEGLARMCERLRQESVKKRGVSPEEGGGGH